MGVKRVFWTWGLVALALVGFGTSFLGDWYMMSAEQESGGNFQGGFGQPQNPDIDDPPILFHTDFWHEAHIMRPGQPGVTAGEEQVPFKGQVLGILHVFYLIGFIGALVAVVGLLFRVRGIVDGKGLIASIAVVSLVSMAFGFVYFSANVADAYNRQLESGGGVSPEIAFFTFGTSTDDGTWTNVTSGPGLGWWGGAVGILAMTAAFGLVYAADLRRARDVLMDDEAAARRFEEETERRRHVMERIRGGGGN